MTTLSSSPLLLFLLFSVTPCISSLLATDHAPVLLPLSHTHSNTDLSTPHLVRSSAARSAARLRRRRQLPIPLSPGGDYVLSLTLGLRQSQPVSLYMDTGSDLVWLPCHPFECMLCEGKPASASPPFNRSSSPAVACRSPLCSAAHSALPASDLCAIAGCPLSDIETSDCAAPCPPFYSAYGDGSLVAHLRRDRLTVGTAELHNFTFGCAHTTLAEPVGVAGFGRGRLSLPGQLVRLAPLLAARFSYCLVAHSFDSAKLRLPSPLILGRADSSPDKRPALVYTPMLDNPKHPYFYSISLLAITVGNTTIAAPNATRRIDSHGGGGVVVDSGTTFTMLPHDLYADLLHELHRQIGGAYERAAETESASGLGLCYYYTEAPAVPAVVLHFAGGARVKLPAANYFGKYGEGKGKRRVGCLMVMAAWEDEEAAAAAGPAAILGNYQQQGFEVVYDLERRRVGFARRECEKLWDEVAGGGGT